MSAGRKNVIYVVSDDTIKQQASFPFGFQLFLYFLS